MANLKDVIYLSNSDYYTLATTGTVTIGSETLTYDENNLYITPDSVATATEDGLMSASDKVKLDNIATSVIPATSTANKMLVSTSTSGTAKWSDWSSAGFLKTNASGVISVDTNSYLPLSGGTMNQEAYIYFPHEDGTEWFGVNYNSNLNWYALSVLGGDYETIEAVNFIEDNQFLKNKYSKKWYAYKASNLSAQVGGTQRISCTTSNYSNYFQLISSLANEYPTAGDIVIQQSSAGNKLIIGVISSIGSSSIYVDTKYISSGTFACLEEGTKITMADGTIKNIEDVNPGDMVKSYNPFTNKPTQAICIINSVDNISSHKAYLMFEGNRYLSINWTHDIYNKTKGTWTNTDRELDVGDVCIGENGQDIKFLGPVDWVATPQNKEKRFYNLITNNNCFYANGILIATNPLCQNKFRGLNDLAPESLKVLTESYKDETSANTDLMENNEFFEAHMQYIGTIMENRCRMGAIKNRLNATDYVAIKKSEGLEVDESIIEQRNQWRIEYNQIEEQQAVLEAQDNALKVQYSIYGDDILLSPMELRAKFFRESFEQGETHLQDFIDFFTELYKEPEEEEVNE